ncbi:MAG: hypothetical protein Q8P92_04645 [Candidatus Daviesbacteria bacterium]|nr:hypothetical protein [Candidatus Daviesbacteria bacterium]
MITVETRNSDLNRKSQIKDTAPSLDDYQVFNVSLYVDLYNRVLGLGLSSQEAHEIMRFAAINDSVGVVTEKLSGEKDSRGEYIFDVEDRIRMQLTPPRHYYFHEKDPDTEEYLMVAPEHRWKDFKRDILETISDWRRGMDKVSMTGVRTLFLDAEDTLKEGEHLYWFSSRAEGWEGETVVKYNGSYGFLYDGRVTTIDGARALEVHDFKNDLYAEAYQLFWESLEGEVYQNPLFLDHPMVDKVKSTVVRTKDDFGIEAVWRRLGEIQEKATGKNEVFGLPVETIIALQDTRLQDRIREEVAIPVADWLVAELTNRTPVAKIQSEIRQKFIDQTKELLLKIKLEKLSDRKLDNSLLAATIPLSIDSSSKYINPVDQAILARYTGSNGDGCGSWGGANSSSFSIGGFSDQVVSSVSVLSSIFSKEGGKCIICGEANTCTKKCYKCGGALI